MKIAITADLHLTNRDKHPERFHALENLLNQVVDLKIDTLIIAGDLFDATCDAPGEFEEVVKRKNYSQINIFIIPGNHDPAIVKGLFSSPNINFITTPQVMNLAEATHFLFVPYINGSSMGEIIAENISALESGSWVLIGHGDWLTGMVQKNAYETGTYMPLSRRDLLLYNPGKVFLGHIHARMDSSVVHYPGSPCATDPTETGYRSFILFDTEKYQVSQQIVDTDFLYFDEHITVLPMEDEEAYIRNQLQTKIHNWNLSPEHKSKVRVRVKARGYSKDRQRLTTVIRDQLIEFEFADGNQPDISQVKVSNDLTKENIATLVKRKIDEMVFDPKPEDANPDDILQAALETIFGGK